jgi:tetratricopeptide (TPR) repeat protein
VEAFEARISELERRIFLLLTGGAVVAPTLGWLASSSERLALALDRPSRLDAAILDELADRLATYHHLDDELGSAQVSALVLGYLHTVDELLKGSLTEETRTRLTSLAGEAASLAGWLFHDLGQDQAAESHLRLAHRAANEAGDQALAAFALGRLSVVQTRRGNNTQALALTEEAAAVGPRSPSAKVSTYVATVESLTRANAGDREASRRALDRADEALGRSDAANDPPWIYFVDEALLTSWKGMTYVRLGRWADAEETLTTGLATLDPSFVRERSDILIDLATVRTRQQEVDEASRLLGEALEVTVATGSSRMLQRIRDLRRELQPWSETASVKALDDQLQTTKM